VIVPSISDTTTRSVESHTNIRAVHAGTVELDKENVMVLAPDLRLRDFWRKHQIFEAGQNIQDSPIGQRSTAASSHTSSASSQSLPPTPYSRVPLYLGWVWQEGLMQTEEMSYDEAREEYVSTVSRKVS